jgi:hypothetical protein
MWQARSANQSGQSTQRNRTTQSGHQGAAEPADSGDPEPPHIPTGTVAKAILFLLVVFAIQITTIVSVVMLVVLPPGKSPAYALFPYDDETVAISLWGGLVPILASLSVMGLGTRSAHDPRPFRSRSYWLVVAVMALVATTAFSASHELIGGLKLSAPAAYVAIQLGAITGIGYWWFRGRGLSLAQGTAECFVMGSLGMFASDAIRTFSLLTSAPSATMVWGGGGLHDLVLWLGLYMSISFLLLQALLSLQNRLSRLFSCSFSDRGTQSNGLDQTGRCEPGGLR